MADRPAEPMRDAQPRGVGAMPNCPNSTAGTSLPRPHTDQHDEPPDMNVDQPVRLVWSGDGACSH